MNKKATFSPHILSLSAIFILGQGVLIFPLMGTDEFGFSAYLIAVVGIMIFYPVISFLWNKINGGNIVFSLILLAVSVFSLFTASGTFKEIVDFVSKIILPDTSKFFISVILGIVVICFSLKPHESLLKFSLVSLVIIIGVILFYFIEFL